MVTADPIPAWAALTVPPWLWGGMPEEFFSQAELRVRRVDATSGVWQVQTDERYRRTNPGLVTAEQLAGPLQRRSRFDLLTSVVEQVHRAPGANAVTNTQLADVAERARRSQDLTDLFYLWQLQTMVASPEELADTVAGIHQGIRALRLESSANEKPLQNASVHLIRRAPVLAHRARLVSVFLRMAHDERLKGGDVSHLKTENLAGKTVFASADGLLEGIALLHTYIGPLLGALAPALWGFASPRASGPIIYGLGRPLAGTRPGAAELLQLLPTRGPTNATWDFPTPGATAYPDAINWWSARLNELFGVLTDLGIFTDRAGIFSPAKHHQALLTVEQLFARVSSVQTSHRDAHAQRVLLFTVLDTLERLTGRPTDTNCSLPFAQKTLNQLRIQVPTSAAEVLLPAAERAVAALEQVQDGFFMASSGQTRGGSRRIAGMVPDDAAAKLIKVLRNATHGHGSNREGNAGRTNALLAHHNGSIPHDLPLVGYLYLLDLMTKPQELRRRLYDNGRV